MGAIVVSLPTKCGGPSTLAAKAPPPVGMTPLFWIGEPATYNQQLELATSNWQLAIGNWQLATDNQQLDQGDG